MFENFTEDARKIETEMRRLGVVLGIDWQDDFQVRALVREALRRTSPPAGEFAPSYFFNTR